jgi:peptide/nickel transport system substrate-binding protein
MFFKPYLFVFTCILGLVSCTHTKKDGDVGLLDKGKNDTLKYIKLKDAPVIMESWSKKNTLIYHDIGEPDDLHPTNGNSAARSEIFMYTQQFLLGTDYRTLKPKAALCKTLPKISKDGLQYTFQLKDSPRWDDGSPISAEDVVFTFKANKCPLTNNPQSKSGLENLKNILIDKKNNTLVFSMKRLHINNLTIAGGAALMQRKFFDPQNILARYTMEQFDDPKFKADQMRALVDWASEFNGAKYSRDINFLVGMGPYKIARWDAGQSLTLVKKKNHWTDNFGDSSLISYPEKIIFKINRDVNSQMLEFKSQSMDASTYLSTIVLLQLKKDKLFNTNYNSEFTNTYDYSYISMNTRPDGITHKKLFTDKKVRRAMAYLVPMDIMNKIINKGMNKRMIGPVATFKPEFNDTLKVIPFDVAKARKLLDEAGWVDTDGDFIRDKVVDGEKIQLSFNLNYMTTRIFWKDIAQIVSEAMYKAGVKANINPLDFAVHYDKARNHDFDMMIAGWAGSSAPEDFTQVWHTNSWSTKGSNFAGFGNSYTDILIDSIKYTIDNKIRIPVVKRFQAAVYDEQPYIFLFSETRRNVIHKRFGHQEMYFERPGVLLNTLKLLQK